MKNPRYYPYERNRYFYGKLLTVRDFESEQKYSNDKRRLINRLLFGSGVVCGLQVVAVDDQTISVEAGVALDCSGREIVAATPVTQKLSMIDGFVNNEYAKNVYLCIAYDEKGKEPVHSVAGSSSSSEEVSEYNRIQESFRLFVREEAPDPSSVGVAGLVEDSCLLYRDAQVRIWQKTPRYVNPGEQLDITLVVEKTLQTPQIQVDYQVESEHFSPVDGGMGLQVSFTEPDYGQETEYRVRYPMKAGSDADITGKIGIKDGRMRLKIGDKQLDVEADGVNTVQIVKGSVREKILNSYFDLSLEQCVECPAEQCIYLAKINLLHMGRTYLIEKVQNVPYGEYVYNTSLLHRLGVLGGGSGPAAGFSARASASLLPEGNAPYLLADFDAANNEFDFKLGIPQLRGDNQEINSGVVDIELETNPRAGKSYFSGEIAHGLGLGPVFVSTGIEEDDNMLLGVEQYKEQIFFGSGEVFQKSPFESTMPPVSVGVVVYPKNGTFRVGVRLLSGTKVDRLRLRWWAYKK